MIEFIIGIDPGKKGCLWSINRAGVTGRWIDMPVIGGEINLNTTLDFFKLFPVDKTLVVIEKAFYSPMLRGQSGFSFGKAYMAMVATTVAMGFKHELLPPIKWKREYSLIRKSKTETTKQIKGRSIATAIRLNPGFRSKFIYQRGKVEVRKDGRAEAFLIAEYGRRYFM